MTATPLQHKQNDDCYTTIQSTPLYRVGSRGRQQNDDDLVGEDYSEDEITNDLRKIMKIIMIKMMMMMMIWAMVIIGRESIWEKV